MSTTTTVLRTWQVVSRSSTHAEYITHPVIAARPLSWKVSAAGSNRLFLAAWLFRVSAGPVNGKVAAAAAAATEEEHTGPLHYRYRQFLNDRIIMMTMCKV